MGDEGKTKTRTEEICETLANRLDGQANLTIVLRDFEELWGVYAPDPDSPEWTVYASGRYGRKDACNRYWRLRKVALRLDVKEPGQSLILHRGAEAGQAMLIGDLKRRINGFRNAERVINQYAEGQELSNSDRACFQKARDTLMTTRLRLANAIPNLGLPASVSTQLMDSIVPPYRPAWEPEEQSHFHWEAQG